MLKSFFNLTKKERDASIYFLMFMVVLLGIKYWVSSDENTSVSTIVVKQVSSERGLKEEKSQVHDNTKSNKSFKEKVEKEYGRGSEVSITSFFDPNNASHLDWISFGLSEKQSETVMKFISSKGGITDPEELLNLYVLSKENKEILVKWSKISVGKINKWNQNDFKKIKGIGEVLSLRIVKFRDKLGGFYSLDQLNEVYGLDSLVVSKIKKRTKVTTVNQIEINNLSFAELVSHPYIGKKEAKLIIKQRTILPFREESQLFEVFSEQDKIKRIRPYVKYE
ncbi:MAG: competence protein ComEA [Saprospiraceae bacterium]|jgi:competence protein ComEA